MKRVYDVYVYVSPKGEKLFVEGVTRSLAERIMLELSHHFQLRHSRAISDVAIHRPLAVDYNRNYNVYMSGLSAPFINKVTRSQAVKVQKALARVLKVKSVVRYWRPGTDGRFMKKVVRSPF